jgi:hypothetical protein
LLLPAVDADLQTNPMCHAFELSNEIWSQDLIHVLESVHSSDFLDLSPDISSSFLMTRPWLQNEAFPFVSIALRDIISTVCQTRTWSTRLPWQLTVAMRQSRIEYLASFVLNGCFRMLDRWMIQKRR